MQRGTLSFRITLVLVAGFVLLQLSVFALASLSTTTHGTNNVGLPTIRQTRAMVALIEALPPQRRVGLASALDGALFHVLVTEGPLPPTVESLQGMDIGKTYSSGLPGRELSVTGQVARFPLVARVIPWAAWWRGNALALHVRLSGDHANLLTIASQPSEEVRIALRQRAGLLGLGGTIALAALTLAVRATTRPLSRLARDIRRFRGQPETPDLTVTGSHELRDLAEAYNEMKARIADLLAEQTRILAAIAHDMRTYITRFRLRAEFIVDDGPRERAGLGLDEMAALLDDTLSLARSGSDAHHTRRPVDLVRELTRLVDIYRELGEPVTLTTATPAASTLAEPMAIRRIVSNLIDNGLRYASNVQVALATEGDQWRVTVEDDGPGVPAEKLGMLGKPFGRIDPSRDRARGGAGLGLAIVQALAAAQGGKVRFTNRPQGGLSAAVYLGQH